MKRSTALALVVVGVMGSATPAAARRDPANTTPASRSAAAAATASQPSSQPVATAASQPIYRRDVHLPLLRKLARPQLAPATLRALVRAAGRTRDTLWLG
ncbi:MAG: hypothetical protein KC503_01100, partial [Myxococcales bacterium]|nr:hypothetical protein [Myxococcales bacterium]